MSRQFCVGGQKLARQGGSLKMETVAEYIARCFPEYLIRVRVRVYAEPLDRHGRETRWIFAAAMLGLIIGALLLEGLP